MKIGHYFNAVKMNLVNIVRLLFRRLAIVFRVVFINPVCSQWRVLSRPNVFINDDENNNDVNPNMKYR